MSSQEIKSINERENHILKEQARQAGWTEEDLRAAFHEDERQDEAPWTKLQRRKRARALNGSKMRVFDLEDEEDGEFQRALANSLGVAHDEAGTSAGAAALLVDQVVDISSGDEGESVPKNGTAKARAPRREKPSAKVTVVELSDHGSDHDATAAKTQRGHG